MNRKSKVWSLDSEGFKALVETCTSEAQVLRGLGLRAAGGNFKSLSLRLRTENLVIPKIKQVFFREGKPLSDILVSDSSYSRNHLKTRLLNTGILENKCVICGQPPTWNDKKLVMVLDHINGVYDDNRIENLRLICPNCNSQTATFAGRNSSKIPKKNICISCGKEIYKKAAHCKSCAGKLRGTKIVWPELEELDILIKSLGYEGTGRQLGVSGSAVKRHYLKLL